MSLVCRTCLSSINNDSYHALDKTFPSVKYPSLEDRCKLCVPEINFSAIKNAVLCDLCYRKIVTLFNFKIRCFINETKIYHLLNQTSYVDQDNLSLSSTNEEDLEEEEEEPSEHEIEDSNENEVEDSNENQVEDTEEPETLELIEEEDVTNPDMFVMDTETNDVMDPNIETIITDVETVVTETVITDMTNTTIIEGSQTFFECNKCNYSTAHQRNFQKHMELHKRNNTSTEVNKRGKFPYALYIQKNSKTNELSCRICKQVYLKRQMLVNHIRRHLEKGMHKCPYCERRCSSKANLRTHMKIHTGVKPYECDYCNFCTIYTAVLRSHMRKHTGEKPYKCDECDFSCSKLPALKAHKIKHNGEKPFKCDQCPKSYAYLCSLIYHKKAHAGIKPHTCEVCKKSFSERYELARHTSRLSCNKRLNSNPKPRLRQTLKCLVCNYTCRTNFALEMHSNEHLEKDVRKCLYCDSEFIGLTDVLEHLKTHPEYNMTDINTELENDLL